MHPNMNDFYREFLGYKHNQKDGCPNCKPDRAERLEDILPKLAITGWQKGQEYAGKGIDASQSALNEFIEDLSGIQNLIRERLENAKDARTDLPDSDNHATIPIFELKSGSVVITMDVPGASKGDVEVDVSTSPNSKEQAVLTVNANLHHEQTATYVFVLKKDSVRLREIHSNLENGVLTLSIPLVDSSLEDINVFV